MNFILQRELEAEKQFQQDTPDHQMTVLHHEGEYKHLRFQSPNTNLFWYDIHTAPGFLTITGDVGTFSFRLSGRNPLAVFNQDRINPSYWKEKLAGKPDSVMEFSSAMAVDFLTTRVEEIQDSYYEENISSQLQDQLNFYLPSISQVEDEEEARKLLSGMSFFTPETGELKLDDLWETSLTLPSVYFMWHCAALQHAAHKYFAEHSAVEH